MAYAYSCRSADHAATKLAKQAEILWREWSSLEETRCCLALEHVYRLAENKAGARQLDALWHCIPCLGAAGCSSRGKHSFQVMSALLACQDQMSA